MTSEGISSPWTLYIERIEREHEPKPPRGRAILTIGLVAGALLGSALTAVAAHRIGSPAQPPEAAQAVRLAPPAIGELPPEWRPQIRRLDLDSMYMQKR
jgi:hypothetical protein